MCKYTSKKCQRLRVYKGASEAEATQSPLVRRLLCTGLLLRQPSPPHQQTKAVFLFERQANYLELLENCIAASIALKCMLDT